LSFDIRISKFFAALLIIFKFPNCFDGPIKSFLDYLHPAKFWIVHQQNPSCR